jgi:hypothetical protein
MAPCVHEAGHAVIAHVLGGRVRHVRIDTEADGSGDSEIGGIEDLRTKLIVRLAGLPAERRYCEMVGDCPTDRDPLYSAHDDKARAGVLAREVYPGDTAKASKLLKASRATAQTLVQEKWDRIESVAIALYESTDNMIKASQFRDLMNM